MYVGLYDADLVYHQKSPVLNLEIMKMSSYFRRQGHVVALVADIQKIDKYDKVFIRKDIPSSYLPSSFLLQEKIEWGGLAYTGGTHVWLDPIEIERMIPDLSIYYPFLKHAEKNNIIKDKTIARSLGRRNYVRYFIDGQKINLRVINKNKQVFLYDTNIVENEGWEDELIKLEELTCCKIHFVYPTKVENEEDVGKFLNLTSISKDSILLIDYEFTKTIIPLIRKYEKQFIQKSGHSINIDIWVGKKYDDSKYTTTFFWEDLLEKINLFFIFQSKGIKVRLKLYNHGTYNKYEWLYRLVARWTDTRFRDQDSLRDVVKKNSKVNLKNIDKLEKLDSRFAKILDYSPNYIRKGGTWVYEKE